MYTELGRILEGEDQDVRLEVTLVMNEVLTLCVVIASEAVLSLPPSDVLGRLKAVIREFDRWGSTATYMHPCCRMIARKGIVDRLNAVEEGLGDVFWEGEA